MTLDAIDAYPLCWPAGWRRTAGYARKRASGGAPMCAQAMSVRRLSGFRFGSVRHFFRLSGSAEGWKFIPNVAHRRGSRKLHPTPESAVPSWCRGAKLVPRLASSAGGGRDE